jgi:hypothetical protein
MDIGKIFFNGALSTSTIGFLGSDSRPSAQASS